MTSLRCAALAFAVAIAAGCAGDEPADESERSEPLALPEAERKLGFEACERYAARVCACTGEGDEVDEACALARSRPQALEMALGAAGARGDLEERDRAVSRRAARRIIETCVEADARLDPAECPRVAPDR